MRPRLWRWIRATFLVFIILPLLICLIHLRKSQTSTSLHVQNWKRNSDDFHQIPHNFAKKDLVEKWKSKVPQSFISGSNSKSSQDLVFIPGQNVNKPNQESSFSVSVPKASKDVEDNVNNQPVSSQGSIYNAQNERISEISRDSDSIFSNANKNRLGNAFQLQREENLPRISVIRRRNTPSITQNVNKNTIEILDSSSKYLLNNSTSTNFQITGQNSSNTVSISPEYERLFEKISGLEFDSNRTISNNSNRTMMLIRSPVPRPSISIRTTGKYFPWTPKPIHRHTGIPPVRPDRYVSLGEAFKDGRGLGNQMFNIAAAIYMAALCGRTFVIEKVNYSQIFDEVFDFSSVPRMTRECPCFGFIENYKSMGYDELVEDVGQPGHYAEENPTIIIGGYFQSWKYTRHIESRLRSLFQFKPKIRMLADKFFTDHHPPGWDNNFTKVAIHVRRGDMLSPDKLDYGYVVPNVTYFHRAMKYYLMTYKKVQFITVSEDEEWTKTSIILTNDMLRNQVNLTYSLGNLPGVDMAIMSRCDHVIMSGGTFGWWAGFLSGGLNVYYSDWPREGSKLHRLFVRSDFYPPSWIGMSDREDVRQKF